jgi:glutamyl/glutaminyl-tRNA synthetase
LPLLLNPDKSKLSKRQGDVAVEDFVAKGYLPEVLINYTALLGWNPKNDQEIFSIEELIKQFSIDKINKSGAVFDINKLNWFNSEYIRLIIKNGEDNLKNLLKYTERFLPKHGHKAAALLHIFGSRLNCLSELPKMAEFLFQLPDYSSELLVFKKSDLTKTKEGLNLALGALGKVEESNWQQTNLDSALQNISQKHQLKPGDIFWPVRVAVSGLEQSPSPGEILEFLGKEESLKRINKAIKKIG